MKQFALTILLGFLFSIPATGQGTSERIPYRKGDLWGFADSNRKILIVPRWSEVSFFSEGIAKVFQGDAFGLIDTTGKLIVPIAYSYPGDAHILKRFSEWMQDGLFPVSRSGKYGVMNRHGRLVVPLEYDWLGEESEGVRVYIQDGVTGLLNRKGKAVCALQDVRLEDCQNGFSLIVKVVAPPDTVGETPGIYRYGLVNRVGKVVLPPDFEAVRISPFGLAEFEGDGRGGVVDTNGNIFSAGLGRHLVAIGPGWMVIQRATEAVIFNTEGDTLATLPLKQIDPFSGEYARILCGDGKMGFLDKSFRIAIPCTLQTARAFTGGVAIAEAASENHFSPGFWNVIDRSGRFLFENGMYDWGSEFTDGVAIVRKQGRYGVVDQEGDVLIEPVHLGVLFFQDRRAGILQPHARVDLVDEGQRLIYSTAPGQTIEPGWRGTGLFFITEANGHVIGLIDKNGGMYFE